MTSGSRTAARPFLPAMLLLAAATLVSPERAQAAWSMHGGNAQHTAISTVPSQSLQQIHWQTPVDLNPQYSGDVLFIHYGSPLVTEGNTAIVTVKVGVQDTFRVEAHRGSDGLLLWQIATDYTLPPHSWVPSVTPTLAHAGRLYVPAAGGTLLWTSALDGAGPHTATRVAFYGDGAYAANPAAWNASLKICTPLTADAKGTVYFGFVAVVGNPLAIQSGIAAVDANGNARYVSVDAASGHVAAQVATNCAPALSRDEQTLYIGCHGAGSTPGYLLALATSDLSTKHVRFLVDPLTAGAAIVTNNGTATPMVASDDKVYYGVLDAGGANASRGWMLQFDSALNPAGAPGAFGWDHTPSLVPKSAVPGYVGPSSYLIMTKYNFYAGAGGNGLNKIAILDPLATQHDAFSGATVMKEVATILGATPDPEPGPSYPGAVKEWCINTAAVDTFTHSVLAGSEDGKLYRWDLATNTFSEQVVLTPGLGEAYTPTAIGPDGQVYAINNATLFAVGASNVGVPPGPVAEGLLLSLPQPNPFARLATLRFRLPRESDVTLEVIDLAGQRVNVLARGVLPAGEHVASWDGTDARGVRRAPGVYFVRLSDGVSSLARKVLLAN
jgi:type IV secretory pathway protease TraF